MLRNLILLGAIVGLSASVPILYQSNPETFERTVRWALGKDDGPATVSMARPMPVAADNGAPLGRRVRMAADTRGHFVGDFRLNGRVVGAAMVDTGATLVAINRSTARRIGINLAESDFRHWVETANGRTHAASVLIDSMEIGRIRVERVQAVVLEDAALSGTLIGMSFLGRLRRFGVEHRTLLLEQ